MQGEKSGRNSSEMAVSVVRGTLFTIAIYVFFTTLIALGIFREVLNEKNALAFLGGVSLIAAWSGGRIASVKIKNGSKVCAMIPSCIFGTLYVLAGIALGGEGGALCKGAIVVLCALMGGLFAAVTKRKTKKKGKRIKK